MTLRKDLYMDTAFVDEACPISWNLLESKYLFPKMWSYLMNSKYLGKPGIFKKSKLDLI